MRKYPWLSLLWFREPGGFRLSGWAGCGGTLVASNYIISAAHCLFKKYCDPHTDICYAHEEYTKDKLAWRVGEHDVRVFGETGGYERFVNIKNIHKHPDYPQKVFTNDNQATLVDDPYYDHGDIIYGGPVVRNDD